MGPALNSALTAGFHAWFSIPAPLAKVAAGYAPVMPTYQGRLGAPETAAILEYIRSLRSPGPATVRSRSATYAPRGR